MFWFYGLEACGILVPQAEIELAPPALKGKRYNPWTTRKSLSLSLNELFPQLKLWKRLTNYVSVHGSDEISSPLDIFP